MANGSSKKVSIPWIVAGFVFVIAALAVSVFYLAGSRESSSSSIVALPANALPQGFASSTPTYESADITANYNSYIAGGTQGVRQYISNLDATTTYGMYENYFMENGWKVTPVYFGITNRQAFEATNGNQAIDVIIDRALLQPTATSAAETVVTLESGSQQ